MKKDIRQCEAKQRAGGGKAMRALLLAAVLCAAAGTAAGCGNGKQAEEEQAVVWKTPERDGETEPETAGDGTSGADESAEAEEAVAAGTERPGAAGEAGAEQSASAEASYHLFSARVEASQVENMVQEVRASWTRDREAIEAGRYEKNTENGLAAYWNGGELVMVEIPAGYEKSPYSKTFEYENGKLIFAYYAGEGQEYRLYFRDDSLFRLNMRVNGVETIKDAAYEDEEFYQWHQNGLFEGQAAYLDAGGYIPTDGERYGGAAAQGADFKFRTDYRNALGNSEAYLISTFGQPDDFYYGEGGEVAGINWYTYQNPYCFFDLLRSADAVCSLISNAGTVFELSADSYTMDEVETLLGAVGGDTYEGESVEGSFSENGDLVFYCEDKSYHYEFILENGKVTKNSRCEIYLVE